MVYIRDDDAEYVSWLERHPSGFVLNVGTGGPRRSMLHTSRCTHLWEPNPALTHTGEYQKACAREWEELAAWALENGHEVKHCPDCRPLPL